MDRISAMKAFVQVAEAGSFTRAADLLRLSPAAMTRGVAELEAHLGARLLNRTTRHVSLTDVGEQYLERCRAALQAFDEADGVARARTVKPQGMLRMHSPVTFGRRFMTPIIARYHQTYPQVQFDLTLSDRIGIDMVEEGFDLAIMLLPEGMDLNVVARQIFRTELALYASPEYLARHERRGPIVRPDQLREHTTLTLSYTGIRETWSLRSRAGEAAEVPIAPLLATNSNDTLLQAALAGIGIAVLSNVVVARELEAGTLKRVLPQWHAGNVGFHAAYPSRRYLPAKVRTFIDVMVQWFELSQPLATDDTLIFTP
jgi:DNA-binding transcriptional LysR family regulator